MLLSLQFPKTSYIRKGAFQQIATSNENHVFLAMTRFILLLTLSVFSSSVLGGQGVATHNNHLLSIHRISVVKQSFVNGVYQPKTSERRHGWEISFKSTLLLVAEGVISTFFGDMPL